MFRMVINRSFQTHNWTRNFCTKPTYL